MLSILFKVINHFFKHHSSTSQLSLSMATVKEVYSADLSQPLYREQSSKDNGPTSIPSITFSQVTII